MAVSSAFLIFVPSLVNLRPVTGQERKKAANLRWQVRQIARAVRFVSVGLVVSRAFLIFVSLLRL